MHVLAFLLTVVGVALSLVYSDVFAMISARGADLSWLKDLASLDAKTLCVLGSSALATLGALFALCKKRFGSLLLLAAAGVFLYCEFKLGIVYPYVRAAAGLFGAAAVFGWFRRRDDDEEEDDADAAEMVGEMLTGFKQELEDLRLARTVEPMNWLSGFWKTMPSLLRIAEMFSSLTSRPSIRICPSFTGKRPAISFASVDFPDPLWPMIVT